MGNWPAHVGKLEQTRSSIFPAKQQQISYRTVLYTEKVTGNLEDKYSKGKKTSKLEANDAFVLKSELAATQKESSEMTMVIIQVKH